MPCFSPLHGWYTSNRTAKGKRSLTFNRSLAYVDMPLSVPCGQCIGCRLERSRQWAIRCVHEASLHDTNCFITLTFNPENMRPDGSLYKEDFQKFMKRLRKCYGSGVRYFHCGEYGELLSRPHHHACLFNFDFADKVLYTERSGTKLYRSASLEKLWPYGFCTIGEVTFESAAYVARYITKKVTGKKAPDHYGTKTPEYITMSRRPGIAHDWIQKWVDDVYPEDKLVVRKNFVCKPPKYYDNIYDVDNPKEMRIIKSNRKKAAQENPNNTPERMVVREKVTLSKLKSKGRCYENSSI